MRHAHAKLLDYDAADDDNDEASDDGTTSTTKFDSIIMTCYDKV